MTNEKSNEALMELSKCDTERLDGLSKKCSTGEELSLEDLESVSGGCQPDGKTVIQVAELIEHLNEITRTGVCPICKNQIPAQDITGKGFERHVQMYH
jgi:hypothetical protein